MFTPDLFPEALAAAQRELADANPYDESSSALNNEPLPGHGPEASTETPEASESRELLSQDDKREEPERYWFWDDSDYAREVCVKRWGEI